MQKLLNLTIGGTAGTIARYLLAGAVYRICGTAFPYGTLIVNLSGCFILGFLASLAEKKFVLNSDLRLLFSL